MDLAQLLDDAPPVHGDITHALIPQALERIASTIKPGHRTIETGSGHSTIAFALTGAEHTCIVPDQREVAAIRAYCDAHQVPLDRVSFRVGMSERVLPTLDLGPLDLALIDGSHSFPHVFIDWFYLAEHLKMGSTLIVDDTHLWTGRVLRDFLTAEPGWRLDTELQGRSAVFKKTAPTVLDRVWFEQPYVARRSGFGRPLNKARQAVSMVRHGQAGDLRREVQRKLRR